MGSDRDDERAPRVERISTHAPRVGSDDRRIHKRLEKVKFQLTLPVWGATAVVDTWDKDGQFQLTLPVWGATIVEI